MIVYVDSLEYMSACILAAIQRNKLGLKTLASGYIVLRLHTCMG